MIYLRSEHIIDTPADVLVIETSTSCRNYLGTSRGEIKRLWPGFYDCFRLSRSQLKVGTVFVAESTEPIREAEDVRPYARVICGVCLWHQGTNHLRKEHAEKGCRELFKWLHNSPYDSIGMNVFAAGCINLSRGCKGLSLMHIKIWNEIAKQYPNVEKTLYIHPMETNYFCIPQTPGWTGEWRKVKLWNIAFPNLKTFAEAKRLREIKYREDRYEQKRLAERQRQIRLRANKK